MEHGGQSGSEVARWENKWVGILTAAVAALEFLALEVFTATCFGWNTTSGINRLLESIRTLAQKVRKVNFFCSAEGPPIPEHLSSQCKPQDVTVIVRVQPGIRAHLSSSCNSHIDTLVPTTFPLVHGDMSQDS